MMMDTREDNDEHERRGVRNMASKSELKGTATWTVKPVASRL